MFGIQTEIIEKGNLIDDFGKFENNVNKHIPKALQVVGAQMKESLSEHIINTVYNTDIYAPKLYRTRGRTDRFGSKSLLFQTDDTKPEIEGNKLTFTFEPSGTHTGKMGDLKGYWSLPTEDRPPEDAPLKPRPVHGDDLIRRIETGKGYDWRPRKGYRSFPPRPFWTNFVNDQKNEKIINYFLLGMLPFEVIGDGDDVELDGSEYVDGTNIGVS